ncbi:C-type mannose receptor 2-like [Ylistrum balloti]|uniref:C-type mannose receptor 2-like n=1 Tax=Ylistrum balloti TaxID=509963 RepID=UPI002905DDD1|nr:C-type mannose receptor 2-like [Ylistrum balloti]
MIKGPRSIWIGANDIDSDGVFVWENSGDPVRYTDWSLDSPSNTTDIQSCARLKAGEGWKDISCTKLVKYVCQANVPLDDRTEQVPGSGQESSSIMVATEDMEPTSPSNTEHVTRKGPGRPISTVSSSSPKNTSDQLSKIRSVESLTADRSRGITIAHFALRPALTNLCPSEEWLQYQTTCYLFMHEQVDWFFAKNSCATNNAHMLRIDNTAVNTFIHSILYVNGPRYVWTGANDLDSDGVFVWEDSGDPANYTDWRLNSPRKNNDFPRCARLKLGEGWNDIACTNLVKYVCQTKVHLDDRTEQVPESGL